MSFFLLVMPCDLEHLQDYGIISQDSKIQIFITIIYVLPSGQETFHIHVNQQARNIVLYTSLDRKREDKTL
jgi:hypothetical protein